MSWSIDPLFILGGFLFGAIVTRFFLRGGLKKAKEAMKKLQDEIESVNKRAEGKKEDLKHDLDSASDKDIVDRFHDAFGGGANNVAGKHNDDNSGGSP